MTKKEVLKSVDELCSEIDEWVGKRILAAKQNDQIAYDQVMFIAEGLVVCANQELSFLRDYIEDNVKDD